MLLLYWINPKDLEFSFDENLDKNFSINSTNEMQFYSNMLFPTKNLSYKIMDNCTIKKKSEMEEAYSILENNIILSFYPVNNEEMITISCDESSRIEEGMYIAGEGGPTNVTSGENYNVIFHGNILLIRSSDCPYPNIAIHELLHVLGFNHSENKYNIMFPVTNCKQEIGDDTIKKINELYSVKPLPDLKIISVSAGMSGRYLNLNASIKNAGIKKSNESKLQIFSNEDLIDEFEISPIEVGYGLNIKLTNIFVKKIKIEELKIVIKSDFDELSLDNNEVLLQNQV